MGKVSKLASVLVCASVWPGIAAAAYPERPVTVIVPFGTGGSTDIGVRLWARELEKCLGPDASVVVQNQPGASGQLGFTQIAGSPADGYTLGALNLPNLQLGPITRTDLKYDLDSFDYLGSFYSSRTTLSVLHDSPLKDLPEIVDKARSSGEPIKIGISAIGSDDHLLALKLAKEAGVKVSPIPFGDAAALNNALLGGHADLVTLNHTFAMQNPDKIRPLAVASEEPIPELPGVATFRQQGIEIVSGSTHTIGAPKGLPDNARGKLTGCFEQIGKDPAFLAEAKKLFFIVKPMTAAETEKFVRDEAVGLKAIWEANPW